MPLQHEGRFLERVRALRHRNRCGRHQQVHDAVADGAARCGDDEDRLPHDLTQGPPLRSRLPLTGQCREWNPRHHQQAQQPHAHERHISPRKGCLGQRIARA